MPSLSEGLDDHDKWELTVKPTFSTEHHVGGGLFLFWFGFFFLAASAHMKSGPRMGPQK